MIWNFDINCRRLDINVKRASENDNKHSKRKYPPLIPPRPSSFCLNMLKLSCLYCEMERLYKFSGHDSPNWRGIRMLKMSCCAWWDQRIVEKRLTPLKNWNLMSVSDFDHNTLDVFSIGCFPTRFFPRKPAKDDTTLHVRKRLPLPLGRSVVQLPRKEITNGQQKKLCPQYLDRFWKVF